MSDDRHATMTDLRQILSGEQPIEDEPTAGPPKAPPVQINDQTIALELIESEAGSAEAALEVLKQNPGAISALGDRVSERRAELQSQADEQAAAEWSQTPAGRLAAANAAVAAKAEHDRLVAAGRVLLADEYAGTVDVASMPGEDVLKLAGLVAAEEDRVRVEPLTPREKELDAFKARFWSLARHQRIEQGKALGLSEHDVQTIHSELYAQAVERGH